MVSAIQENQQACNNLSDCDYPWMWFDNTYFIIIAMTELFLKCIEIVLKNEGGFQNNPKDKGNYANGVLKGTNFGISARMYPDLDIENLTVEKAKEIYFLDYWTPCMLDEIEDPNNALQILDFCVTSGQYRAIRTAQKCSGSYEDGIMGPASIKAINNALCFLERYRNERLKYYSNLDDWDWAGHSWTERTMASKIT
jgi:lysozyme family protein